MELEKKTDCHFIYEPIRQGKTVFRLHFRVEPLPFLENAESIEITDIPAASNGKKNSISNLESELEILQSACLLPNGKPEFSLAELRQIACLLVHVPQAKRPYLSSKPNSVFSRRQYLAERYSAMNRASEKKPIKHRFNYLLKMIRRDIGMD